VGHFTTSSSSPHLAARGETTSRRQDRPGLRRPEWHQRPTAHGEVNGGDWASVISESGKVGFWLLQTACSLRQAQQARGASSQLSPEVSELRPVSQCAGTLQLVQSEAAGGDSVFSQAGGSLALAAARNAAPVSAGGSEDHHGYCGPGQRGLDDSHCVPAP